MRVSMEFLEKLFHGRPIPIDVLKIAANEDPKFTQEQVETSVMIMARAHLDPRIGRGILIAKEIYRGFSGDASLTFEESIPEKEKQGQILMFWANILIHVFADLDQQYMEAKRAADAAEAARHEEALNRPFGSGQQLNDLGNNALMQSEMDALVADHDAQMELTDAERALAPAEGEGERPHDERVLTDDELLNGAGVGLPVPLANMEPEGEA